MLARQDPEAGHGGAGETRETVCCNKGRKKNIDCILLAIHHKTWQPDNEATINYRNFEKIRNPSELRVLTSMVWFS